jgi:hypothetical protein
MHDLLKTVAAVAFGLFSHPASAVVLHPYLTDGSDVFSMSAAGRHTGNGIGLGTGDNRSLGVPGQAQVNIGNGPQSTSASQAQTEPGYISAAHATASFGLIRHAASASNATTDHGNRAGAISDAGWIDTLTISNAALTGLAGVMSFGVHVDGTLFAGGHNGTAGWRFGIQASDPLAAGFMEQSRTEGASKFLNIASPDVLITIDELQIFNVGFTFGTPFELVVRSLINVGLRSTTGGGGGVGLFPSSAIADFDNTIFWNGIESVTQNGNAVSYQISALSGTDWTQSFDPDAVVAPPANNVSEPVSLSLLGLGLVGIAATRLRRSNPPSLRQMPRFARNN